MAITSISISHPSFTVLLISTKVLTGLEFAKYLFLTADMSLNLEISVTYITALTTSSRDDPHS